jgi:hypothetical protein
VYVVTGYPVIVKLEQLTDAPETMLVEFRFRSKPDVAPHVPVPTTVEPPDSTNAKYCAVPVLPAVPDVMVLAVATPEDTVKAVEPNVRVANTVPVGVPFKLGCVPW